MRHKFAKSIRVGRPARSRAKAIDALFKAAATLAQEKRYAEAMSALESLLQHDAKHADAWELMAACLLATDAGTAAETPAREAVKLNPGSEQAATMLGRVLMFQRRYQEAAVHLGDAVKRFPDSGRLWTSLAGCFSSLAQYPKAEFCYRRALELEPGQAHIRIELSNVLGILARDEDARTELEAAREAGFRGATLKLAQAISPMPASEEEILAQRSHMAREIEELAASGWKTPSFSNGLLATNFNLAYHGLDDKPLQEAWANLVLSVCPSFSYQARFRTKPSGDRLRVGVVSGNLQAHTIGKLNIGLLQKLPRDRFEVIIFDLSVNNERRGLEVMADKVVPCEASIASMRKSVESEGIDVLYYPDIGMNPASFGLAFSRLAPVQCTTWGHPVTTGIKTIDYFISSDLIEPEGADEHYSEKLVRLSVLPTYYYRPQRSTRKVPTFPFDWNVYLCPQTLFKFHPEFDFVWAEILRRDPKGRLVLIDIGDAYSNKLGDRISAKHPDIIDRVVFLNRMNTDEFMGLMQHCHVMLDTYPFSGGNTNYEAFSFGTPVVTLPAAYMRGRVTAGQYGLMNFTELIAASHEDYIEKAIRVANDHDYRYWLRSEISQRSRSLYETEAVITEVGDFFERAYVEAAK